MAAAAPLPRLADVQGVLTSEEVNELVARALQTGAAKFETKHRMKSGALRERHISQRLRRLHIRERGAGTFRRAVSMLTTIPRGSHEAEGLGLKR